MRNIFVFLGALLLVDDVFGVDETLTVMEGDSVTLKPDTEITEDDTAMWFFGEERIARMNKADGLFSTSDGDKVGFKGKLNLDHQTGSLTITNTRTEHTGLYKVKISSKTETSKIFNVTVSGVFGDDVNLSVMEGDSVTLNLPTVIPVNYSAQWWFGGKIIARMNKADGRFSTFEDVDVRFKGKLNLNNQTGSLTITNTRTDHTGLYKLQIKSTTETFEIFSVTVHGDVVESVSVMEGDTVPLHTGVTDIQRDEIQWKFGDVLIADLNDAADASWSNTDLNNKTGDLTIRNIRRDQSGNYEVKIKNKNSLILHRKFRIRTLDVFGVDETLTVMEGESVTLNPHTEITEDDSALWWFGDKIIAKMKKAAGLFSTFEGVDGRFKGRLNLDHQTGSLTITNTRTEHTGLYKLQIKSTTETSKIFSVTVSGDVVESVSVMEGDTVPLHTGVTDIQRDEIQWKFGGVLIADLNGAADASWSNTDLNDQTGDLTIRNIRRDQSGDYEVKIKNKNSLILHRKFHIRTLDSGLSAGVIAGIVVGVLLLVLFVAAVAGVIYHHRKISELQRPREGAKKNGTNDPLNTETANSDDL